MGKQSSRKIRKVNSDRYLNRVSRKQTDRYQGCQRPTSQQNVEARTSYWGPVTIEQRQALAAYAAAHAA